MSLSFCIASINLLDISEKLEIDNSSAMPRCCRASAGSRPYSWAIWDFSFNGSMVPWFHGSMVIRDCSAVQSAVFLSKCLAAAPVFLLGTTRHFVWLLCKICAEIVVYRMLAVFLNGLNGKNSSRIIVQNIFSVYFFIQVSRLVIASILLSHRLLSR